MRRMLKIVVAGVTRRAPLVCALMAAALAASLVVRAQGSGVMVIDGGTLIDGTGREPVRDALLVIRGNRIESVGRRGQVSIPSTARVVRADGKFIVPGLTDAHVHFNNEWMSELFLHYGVTSVFEIGGGGEWGLVQRAGIARGKIFGPRLFVAVGSLAGARIAALGGVTSAEGMIRSRFVVDTGEKAREVVRRYLALGADMIKVHRGPPMEVYQAAAEEAHGAGKPLIVQALGPTVYAREAVMAGADILEHAAGISYSVARDPAAWKGWGDIEEHSLDPSPFADMDDGKAAELIALLVQRHVSIEPDLIAQGRGLPKIRERYEYQDYRLLSDQRLSYLPESSRRKWLDNFRELEDADPKIVELRQKGWDNNVRFVTRFVKAGGNVLAGTDASGNGWATPGLGLHHELELLVDAGLTPHEAIRAATRNTAEAFRILDRQGTLEAGKLADLVIVSDDPLEDIRNLQKIDTVVKDGEVVDRSFHPWYRNPLPYNAIEGSTWVAGVKKEMESMRTTSFGQPPPAIESISPTIVTEGSPTLTLAVRGFGFTSRSRVQFGGEAVPFERVSDTELKLSIDARLLSGAGTFPIVVTNPAPLQRAKWGGTSNTAYLLVNFKD